MLEEIWRLLDDPQAVDAVARLLAPLVDRDFDNPVLARLQGGRLMRPLPRQVGRTAAAESPRTRVAPGFVIASWSAAYREVMGTRYWPQPREREVVEVACDANGPLRNVIRSIDELPTLFRRFIRLMREHELDVTLPELLENLPLLYGELAAAEPEGADAPDAAPREVTE